MRPAFSAFGAPADVGGARPWLASLAASSAIYVAVGVAIVLFGTATKRIVQEKRVDVTFVEKVVTEPPPPPPPVAVPAPEPQAPAAMAPGVRLMRGEETFVSAAVKTVKTWRYQPARYKGQPITVYRIIQIPFKLTA